MTKLIDEQLAAQCRTLLDEIARQLMGKPRVLVLSVLSALAARYIVDVPSKGQRKERYDQFIRAIDVWIEMEDHGDVNS